MNTTKLLSNAAESKIVLREFLDGLPLEKKNKFRTLIHLRPTDTGITVVTTMAEAPMRGLVILTIEKLQDILPKLLNVVNAKNVDEKLDKLNALKFEARKTEGIREENIQAFLIRAMIADDKDCHGIQFVASELNLFECGESSKTKRVDVIGYKDGILYDIELKNKRDTSTITQAAGYVSHMRDHLAKYQERLEQFPNYTLGKIEDVKGIALVPYADKSSGKLEDMSREQGIDLWFFNYGFSIMQG